MESSRTRIPDRYNASQVLFHNLDEGREGKVAIRCGEEEVTYGELCETANRVGNGLGSLGLEPGARVLLLLLDSPRLPASFFGALRAGVVPIPANTVLHPPDYAFMLRDSGAEAVIVDQSLAPRIDAIQNECPELRHVVVVDHPGGPGATEWADWVASSSPVLDPRPTARDEAAFWLYSSGSTGFPKGVVHCHGSVPCTIDTYARRILGIDESDVTFSASKAFHAYGLGNNITFPYAVGAGTVLFPGRPTPEAVFDHIRRYEPTLFFTAPTLYAAMLAHAADRPELDMGRVRLCVSAAEALPADVFQRWRERFGVEILDGIGSTEMLHIFISNRPGRCRPGSSGLPVPGYDAIVVDEASEPLGPGTPGNLMVRGDSCAVEYWGRPEKSAHAFREGWCFTGDRYHTDGEGYFYYEGRSDDMFKVSGQWVSPIELESVLAAHPAVLECAVVPFQDESELTKPRALVVLEAGLPAPAGLAEELQGHVKSSLAPYKYPRRVEFVAELPKTATGKIQRFRLRGDPVGGG